MTTEKTTDSRERDHIKNHEERLVTPESVRRARQQLKAGRLAIPGEYIEAGKRYYIAKEEEIERAKSLGYQVVQNKNLQLGDQSLTRGHNLGSAVTATLGKNQDGSPQIGVLMEITEELWQINQEVEREKVKLIEDDIGTPKDGMSSVIYKQS